MGCTKPLKGYRSADPKNKQLKFKPGGAYTDLPVEVPCGQCCGCKLERSRQWAMRITHETSLHVHNCFVTLTYNDENLPPGNSLQVTDFQYFMKRLRKKFYPETIRFFHCGEYGEKMLRPHYHAILFNCHFSDYEYHTTKNGYKHYTSQTLDDLWKHGFCSIGEANFLTAGYIARYCMKKITESDKTPEEFRDYYLRTDEHGRSYQLKPEYATMSRRPGIGNGWYNEFKDEAYKRDFVVLNGKKMQPPRYYDDMFDIDEPKQYKAIKNQRASQGLANKRKGEQTSKRLWDKDKNTKAKLSLHNRDLEAIC